MRVYHFLHADHAVSDLAMKKIKLSRFADLNDPFELLGAKLRDRKKRLVFRKFKAGVNAQLGVLCFTKEWSNPILWSHYADKHRGVCLGFDVPDNLLEPVIYVSSRKDFTEASTLNGVGKKLERILLRLKFSGWEYEDEIRMILTLDKTRKESQFHYSSFDKNLSLKEVILGPRCPLTVRNVRLLVDQSGNQIRLIKARLAFNTFNVVADRYNCRPRHSKNTV